jgi:hypothetical protein
MNFDEQALDDATYGRTPMEPVAAPALDPAVDPTERQLAILASLAEMGHDIARAMKNRTIYAAVENKTDDKAAKAYALVAKTVQQVILLSREIREHREKRRASVVSERKAQAKQIVRAAIDRPDPPEIPAQQQRTEKVRAVQRVQLDAMFKNVGDDLVERLSVAELVERACGMFGLPLDPTVRWPDWAELRGEPPPESPPEPSPRPQKANTTIPAHLSGASALGLNGRAPPDPRERKPP